jgi:glycosyltransferase involved in cell wall biosynthesis
MRMLPQPRHQRERLRSSLPTTVQPRWQTQRVRGALPIIVGLVFFALSIMAIIMIVILKLFYGIGPWGWASLVSIILLISGIQFAFIGFIGEYISRIMLEVKGRPLYIIRSKYMQDN